MVNNNKELITLDSDGKLNGGISIINRKFSKKSEIIMIPRIEFMDFIAS